MHTQGISLPSRTIEKENVPKQPYKTNISPTQSNIGPAQTEYILKTSYSCEPRQFQLILDHAGKWY